MASDEQIEAACVEAYGAETWPLVTDSDGAWLRAKVRRMLEAADLAAWCFDMEKAPRHTNESIYDKDAPRVDLLVEYADGKRARLPDCFWCRNPWEWCHYTQPAIGPVKISLKILAWRLPPALPDSGQ